MPNSWTRVAIEKFHGYSPRNAARLHRPSTLSAVLFILLDTGIIHLAPCRALVFKYLNPSTQTDASRTRLVGQVAARAVGSVFLVLMFPAAIRTLIDPEMRSSHYSALYHTSGDSVWCIQVASAYFIYDTYICVFRYAENGLPFLIHGVLCCLAYMYPLVTGNMHYQGAAFPLWECSTPFLYMRWFAIKVRGDVIGPDRKRAWQDRANVLFALAFFLCRIASGPWQSWAYYRASAWDLGRGSGGGRQIGVWAVYAYRTAMVVLNGLNFFWFSTIVKVAMARDGKEATETPSSPKKAA